MEKCWDKQAWSYLMVSAKHLDDFIEFDENKL